MSNNEVDRLRSWLMMAHKPLLYTVVISFFGRSWEYSNSTQLAEILWFILLLGLFGLGSNYFLTWNMARIPLVFTVLISFFGLLVFHVMSVMFSLPEMFYFLIEILCCVLLLSLLGLVSSYVLARSAVNRHLVFFAVFVLYFGILGLWPQETIQTIWSGLNNIPFILCCILLLSLLGLGISYLLRQSEAKRYSNTGLPSRSRDLL